MKNRFMSPNDHRLLRWSLVCVWLTTAVVSLWEWNGQSLMLLATWQTAHAWIKPFLIGAGACVDLLLALWLAWRPGRTIYMAALIIMLVMTVFATWIQPNWWLHPLGPLTKNLPIAAILLVLLRGEKRQ